MHNPLHTVHHDDEARGNISELPDDNWAQSRTVSSHDSGLCTFQVVRISVFPPRKCLKDGNDRKLSKHHRRVQDRYHGDKRRTKNHRCANNRWQLESLKQKPRNGTKTFTRDCQQNIFPDKDRHQNRCKGTTQSWFVRHQQTSLPFISPSYWCYLTCSLSRFEWKPSNISPVSTNITCFLKHLTQSYSRTPVHETF